MTFLSGVLVGAALFAAFVGYAIRKWPAQYDDLIEYLRKPT